MWCDMMFIYWKLTTPCIKVLRILTDGHLHARWLFTSAWPGTWECDHATIAAVTRAENLNPGFPSDHLRTTFSYRNIMVISWVKKQQHLLNFNERTKTYEKGFPVRLMKKFKVDWKLTLFRSQSHSILSEILVRACNNVTSFQSFFEIITLFSTTFHF